MSSGSSLERELETVFEPRQAEVLARVITAASEEHVKTGDFRELKDIVHEIGTLISELDTRIGILVDAQRRTDERVAVLADQMTELATALKQLTTAQTNTERALDRTRSEVAGIGDTLGYTLENEAYRELPKVLQAKHGIEVTKKFIRTVISGTEVDFFAEGLRDGKPVLIVGESKSKPQYSVFPQIESRVLSVRSERPNAVIVPLLVCHFARPEILESAQERNIIVVQSYEWVLSDAQ